MIDSFLKNSRASLASKKDRLECLERKLETYRNHMTREARKAGKLEKKLRTLTAGYQSRNQALFKQSQDLMEQVEAARLELDTYSFLKKQEEGKSPDQFELFLKNLIQFSLFVAAAPQRLETIRLEVQQQMERERQLQIRFQQLQDQCFEASQAAP